MVEVKLGQSLAEQSSNRGDLVRNRALMSVPTRSTARSGNAASSAGLTSDWPGEWRPAARDSGPAEVGAAPGLLLPAHAGAPVG
jgi:hypothetical protein